MKLIKDTSEQAAKQTNQKLYKPIFIYPRHTYSEKMLNGTQHQKKRDE